MDTARVTRLVTAVLARNEAAPDRYLRRVLTRCREFSDAILLLDDGSTDETREVAKELGCDVRRRVGTGFWGASEANARRELWELGADFAGDGWLLIADADMELAGDPRPLCATWECAAWAFPLADLWDSEQTFRVDGPWSSGPATPRPWLFRPRWHETGASTSYDFTPVWPERAIHTGHAPTNFLERAPCFVAPPGIYWKHLGWKNRAHRERKAEQYGSVAAQLSPFERAHAATILD